MAGIQRVSRQWHEYGTRVTGKGLVHVCLGCVVESDDLNLHNDCTACLIECNCSTSVGKTANLWNCCRTGQIGKTQRESIGKNLSTDFTAGGSHRMYVDVQGASKQPVNPGRVQQCAGRYRENCRLDGILIQRHQYGTVHTCERVMYVRRCSGNAGGGKSALYVTGRHIYDQVSLCARERIRYGHFLVAACGDGEGEDVAYGYHGCGRCGDVACGVFGFSAQVVIAFCFARGVPIDHVGCRIDIAKQRAIDEEAHCRHADVVGRGHSQLYDSIDCGGRQHR